MGLLVCLLLGVLLPGSAAYPKSPHHRHHSPHHHSLRRAEGASFEEEEGHVLNPCALVQNHYRVVFHDGPDGPRTRQRREVNCELAEQNNWACLARRTEMDKSEALIRQWPLSFLHYYMHKEWNNYSWFVTSQDIPALGTLLGVVETAYMGVTTLCPDRRLLQTKRYDLALELLQEKEPEVMDEIFKEAKVFERLKWFKRILGKEGLMAVCRQGNAFQTGIDAASTMSGLYGFMVIKAMLVRKFAHLHYKRFEELLQDPAERDRLFDFLYVDRADPLKPGLREQVELVRPCIKMFARDLPLDQQLEESEW